MNYAIAKVSIASVYKASNLRSEMLTQVLFGEVVEVLDIKGALMYISCAWDQVTGWALCDQFTYMQTNTAIELLNDAAVVLSLVDSISGHDSFIPVTLGASLPRFDGIKGSIPQFSFRYNGKAVLPGSFEIKLPWIEKLVLRYLHAPELYGGRSPFGIDSAALSQVVYKILGISLARTHGAQVVQGRTVDFMEFCQPGDLAFFDDGKGNIAHVGIVLSDCSIVHVHGKVRRDKIDHFGIWNTEEKCYTWQLRVVKRHLPDFPDQSMLSRMEQKGEEYVMQQRDQPGLFTLEFDE